MTSIEEEEVASMLSQNFVDTFSLYTIHLMWIAVQPAALEGCWECDGVLLLIAVLWDNLGLQPDRTYAWN